MHNCQQFVGATHDSWDLHFTIIGLKSARYITLLSVRSTIPLQHWVTQCSQQCSELQHCIPAAGALVVEGGMV